MLFSSIRSSVTRLKASLGREKSANPDPDEISVSSYIEDVGRIFSFDFRRQTSVRVFTKAESGPCRGIDITIPINEHFVESLVLQRTTPFSKIGGGPALRSWFATGERGQLFQFLLSRDRLAPYLGAVLRDVSTELDAFIEAMGNRSVGKVVSVGPGNAIFECLLFAKTHFSQLLLIDIEDTKSHHHGFAKVGAGYASLQSTKLFLTQNGMIESMIHTCNPTRQALPEFTFNTFISLISMGFHYPCDDYAEFIVKNAEAGALVVLDKRIDQPDEGFNVLSRHFAPRLTVPSMKSVRHFLTRN